MHRLNFRFTDMGDTNKYSSAVHSTQAPGVSKRHVSRTEKVLRGQRALIPSPVVESDARVDRPLRVPQPQQGPHRVLSQPDRLEHGPKVG